MLAGFIFLGLGIWFTLDSFREKERMSGLKFRGRITGIFLIMAGLLLLLRGMGCSPRKAYDYSIHNRKNQRTAIGFGSGNTSSQVQGNILYQNQNNQS